MQDHEKTKDQLIDELNEIRSRLAETERMKYQRDIQRQNEFLNNVIESLPHPFYVIDVNDYTIKMANSASGQFQSSGEPQTCYRLTHNRYEPCSLGGDLCPLEIVRSTGKPATVEHVHYDKHGNPINVEVHAYPVFDDQGNLAQVIETSYDITERKRTEEALRESEERQRSLIEHLPQRIFIKNRNSVYLSCNENFASDMGITPEQVVGKDDFAFSTPELAQAYRANDQDCMATDMVKDIEEPYLLDGEERWIHTVKVPYHDAQGQVVGVLGIFEDITERKQIEERLKESEERFSKAFLSSSDPMTINTHADGAIVSASKGFCQIFGYTEEEVIGKLPLELKIWDDPEDRNRFVEKVKIEGKVDNIEYRFRNKKGDLIYELVSGSIIYLNGSPHTFIVAKDITERKRTEEALRLAQVFTSALLENILDGVVACDEDGTLVLFNRMAREWHGLDPMAIPQEKWADHYDLYCADGVTPMNVATVPLARAFRGEELRNEGMVIRAKGGPERHILAN
ncbi:MAG: PAS domain S-box protein [Desulfomonilaceae bacterium]